MEYWRPATFLLCALLLKFPVRMVCGYLSDNLRFLTEDGKLLLFNSISLAGAATIYMVLAFLSAESPFLIVILFTSISLCTGASSCGFVRCGIDYGRQYSNFILGVCQLMKSITLFLVPLLAGIFVTQEDSVDQWKLLYVGTAVSLYLANLMFWRFAKTEPPEYTKDGFFEQNIQQVNKRDEVVAEKNE
ncbi:hypothetical protein M3Y97_00444100 [Aphelenchoides bicaudatus]|nr:hypothetical protein M3Y97_00444100 [Aphelenchoides bicaudatus]